MKKIAFYTDAEMLGGAEVQMQTLLGELPLLEKLVIMRDLPVYEEYFQAVSAMINTKLVRVKAKSKHSWQNFLQTYRALKKFKPDLLHLHTWNPMANKYALLAAKFLHIPVLNTQHDPFILNFPKSIYQKWSVQNSEQIVCISHHNAELLKKAFPQFQERIVVIHNGLRLPQQTALSSRELEILKQDLDLPQMSKIILSVGTLHPRKGYLDLLKAFSRVSKEHQDWYLIIAGEGPQKAEITEMINQNQLSDKVRLLGYRNDLGKIYQLAEIFVLASHQEAFGLVIVEALHAGKAIIATKAGGVPEIIENGENGILVEPKNPDLLAQKLISLIQNSAQRSALAENAPSRAQLFSAAKMAENYALQYQLIIARHEN